MTSAATNASQRSRKFSRVMTDAYVAQFEFVARQENDVSVERGEIVTVLNMDDSDWFWVRKSNMQEGFVPSNYVRRADASSSELFNQSCCLARVQYNAMYFTHSFALISTGQSHFGITS